MRRPAVEGYAGQLLYVLRGQEQPVRRAHLRQAAVQRRACDRCCAKGQAKEALAKKDKMQDAPQEQAADEPQQKEAPQAAPQQRVPAKR